MRPRDAKRDGAGCGGEFLLPGTPVRIIPLTVVAHAGLAQR